MIKRLKGSLMLLTAALIWGTAFAAQSKGMDYVEPFTYNSIRTLLGGFALLPVITAFRHTEQKAECSAKTTISGGICCGSILFAASSFQQLGISLTSAGKAGFITALYVIIVPLISLFLGKKSDFKIWLCSFLAAAGFYMLCVKDSFDISRGDLYVLISAVFYAFHIIVIDFFNSKSARSIAMSCIQFFTAGTAMAVCMFIFEEPSLNSIFAAKYTILYTGIMSCAVAYTLQIIGQRYTPPTAATLIMSLESVFAALSGWILLNEKMSFKEVTGCILVFIAAVSAQLDLSFKKHRKTIKSRHSQ